MIGCNCEVCTSEDPKDNRLRSSILLQSHDTTLVVDTTPDFRTQMLREHVMHLDGIILTHPHKDHIAGLDDIKAYNYFQHQPMDVYANLLTQEALKREFHYIFAKEKYPGVPAVHLHTIDDTPFMAGGLEVIPIKVFHFMMPVLGFRFGPVTYITDANKILPEEKEKIRGSKILIVNALRIKKHISHFSLEEAIALVEELRIEQAWFTHISHQMGKQYETSVLLPDNMQLAYDGLKIRI